MVSDMKRNTQKTPGIRPCGKEDAYRIEYYDWNNTHRTKTFHGKYSDAVKLRRSIISKVDRIKNGLELPPDDKRRPKKLYELWDQFHEDYKIRVKSGTIEQFSLDRYVNSINAFYNSDHSLENKLITQLNTKDFERLKIDRLSNGFSPHGINTILRNLKTIFRYGITNQLIKHNPMVNVGNVKTDKNDVRYLNEGELSSLNKVLETLNMNHPVQKDAHDLVIFYLYTGARTSEILYPHFNWDCVQDNRITFPKTKSNKERIIPVTEKVASILDSRKDLIGGPFFTETGAMSQTLDEIANNHLTRDMVYNRTKYIFKKAGIDDISTHNLRKTAGAYYYIATRDIFGTSRFLGHSSVKVTESHYIGLIQSLQDEYSEKFNALLSQK